MNGFHIESFKTSGGVINARVIKDGKTITLHSLSPEKESERILAKFQAGLRWTLIAGFGMGYLTEHVLRNTDTQIAIYDHSLEIINFAKKERNLDSLLQNPRIHLIAGEEQDLIRFLDEHQVRELNFTIHRPYFQLFPEIYSRLEGLLIAYLSKKQINRATLNRFQKVWLKNILRNSFHYFSFPGICDIRHEFKNIPAVIAGAGPSLGKSLPVLKTLRKSVLIISTDTALPMLAAHGIIPDFTVSVDPQDKNAYYLLYSPDKSGALVIDASASPLSFIQYNPENTILFDAAFPVYETLSPYWGEKGKLASGGSVSTTAFDLARYFGCDPILFIGQDLSYPGKQTHFQGNILEDFYYMKINRFQTFEQYNARSLLLSDKIEMKAVDGGTVSTDRKFLTFLEWFKREIKVTGAKVINCTESGLWIDGAEHMPLSTAAEKFNLTSVRNKTYRINRENKEPGEFTAMLNGVQKDFRALIPPARDAYHASHIFPDFFRKGKPTGPLLKDLARMDDALRASIRKTGVVGRLIEFTMQGSIEEVLENPSQEMNEETIGYWQRFYSEAYFGIIHIERLVRKRLAMVS